MQKQLDIMDFMSTQTMIHGDCLDEMRKMPDNSIDFIVTDSPYGISFMSKAWDQQIPSIEYWQEMLRICKPGSMMACAGFPRMYHRLACAVEDAGWKIRDCIMHLFGSGFPKGHNNFGLEGYGTSLKPAYEPWLLAMKPLDGTFAQNAKKWGVAGINIDDSRIGSEQTKTCIKDLSQAHGNKFGKSGIEYPKIGEKLNPPGRWPANIILDEEAAEQLDKMTGVLKSGSIIPGHKIKGDSKIGTFKIHSRENQDFKGDSGGASRFFYCAKASSKERNAGLDGMPLKESPYSPMGINDDEGLIKRGRNPDIQKRKQQNFHPTVKPIALMKYILKLLAPPGNPICLDPFAGSGSTLLAAKELGINCIGIEKEEEYFEIAQQRIKNG